jgi:hypothetical protein
MLSCVTGDIPSAARSAEEVHRFHSTRPSGCGRFHSSVT